MLKKAFSRLLILVNILFLSHFEESYALQTSSNSNTLLLYVSTRHKLAEQDGTLTPTGKRLERVEQYLQARDISYEIVTAQWSRAYKEVSSRDNAIIFNIARNPAREENFHWIFRVNPVLDYTMKVYSRNDPKFKDFNPDNIVKENFKAICENHTYSCQIFSNFGFPDNKIIKIPSAKNGTLEAALLQHRADYMMSFDKNVRDNLLNLKAKVTDFVAVQNIDETEVFLAAPKNINSKHLQALLSFPKDVQPLTVLGTPYKPNMYINNSGNIVGGNVDKIRNYLSDKDIPYEFKLFSWERSFAQATSEPNTLIMGLIRTEVREDNFHWLLPLEVSQDYIFVRNEEKYKNLKIADLISGDNLAVCVSKTSQCRMLMQLGFKEDNIVSSNSQTPEIVTSYLVQNRADIMISNEEHVKSYLEKLGLPKDALIPLISIGSSTAYLAAHKTIDPQIIEYIKNN